MTKTYELKHITDIAQLDEYQFKQLLKELPLIHEQFLAIKYAYRLANAECDLSEICPVVNWTYDNIEESEMTVSCEGEEIFKMVNSNDPN